MEKMMLKKRKVFEPSPKSEENVNKKLRLETDESKLPLPSDPLSSLSYGRIMRSTWLEQQQFWKEYLFIIYGMYFPQDFYSFWRFCWSKAADEAVNQSPRTDAELLNLGLAALKILHKQGIPLILSGPFDVLAGRFIINQHISLDHVDEILSPVSGSVTADGGLDLHCRGRAHSPEQMTIFQNPSSTQPFSIVYHRDTSKELPALVACESWSDELVSEENTKRTRSRGSVKTRVDHVLTSVTGKFHAAGADIFSALTLLLQTENMAAKSSLLTQHYITSVEQLLYAFKTTLTSETKYSKQTDKQSGATASTWLEAIHEVSISSKRTTGKKRVNILVLAKKFNRNLF